MVAFDKEEWGPARVYGIAALFVAVGMLFMILACTEGKNAYPILILVPAFLMPTFSILCTSVSGGGSPDPLSTTGGNGWQNAGEFLVGTMFVSTIAMPLVFFHNDVINSVALGYCIGSDIAIYGSLGWLAFMTFDDDDSGF